MKIYATDDDSILNIIMNTQRPALSSLAISMAGIAKPLGRDKIQENLSKE